jgi:hypothetical protein
MERYMELWFAAADLSYLFSFAIEPNCSVSRFLSLVPDYSKLFRLPLSMIASHQLAEVVNSIEEWNREANEKDQRTYIWGSGIYTSKQAYACIIGQFSAPAPFSVALGIMLSGET